MITRWKLLNFKSVKKSVDLPFTNLTLFAGANSSGKSTLLQSILLISQTLGNKISSTSVVLNGQLTRLGQFDDLRSLPRRADSIMVGWECAPIELDRKRRKPGDQVSALACEIRFGIEEAESDFFQLHPILFECKVSAFRNGNESFIRLRRKAKEKLRDKDTLEHYSGAWSERKTANKLYDVAVDRASMADILERLGRVEIIGCSTQHFLPVSVWYGFDEVGHVQNLLVKGRSELGEAANLMSYDFDLSPELLSVLDGIIRKKDLKISLGNIQESMPLSFWQGLIESIDREDQVKLRASIREEESALRRAILSDGNSSFTMRENLIKLDALSAAEYFDTFFSSRVYYLGPLRDEPKALYPFATSVSPFDIGLKGEHTAALLEIHRDRTINYLPSGCFVDPEIRNEPEECDLLTAVVDWLQYMDVAVGVRTEDKGKLGYELKIVQSSEVAHDLTHVGVGVSQVLPIIVMSLLAPAGSVLIFEQPELHLHPKVQTLLADFFLSIAFLNKQCILETHSEYLINRLRYRAACATGDFLSNLLKIYFAELHDGSSVYNEVKVNKYGAIVNWPEGFFDQSQRETESILSAAALKYESEES